MQKNYILLSQKIIIQSLFSFLRNLTSLRFLILNIKNWLSGTSLAGQWLGLGLPTQGVQVRSLIREQRSHMRCGQSTEQKQYYNKFSEDFEGGPHQKRQKNWFSKLNQVLKLVSWNYTIFQFHQENNVIFHKNSNYWIIFLIPKT